jgi:hypothetical protein
VRFTTGKSTENFQHIESAFGLYPTCSIIRVSK